MTPKECRARATAADAAKEKAIEHAAVYAVSFGGSSDLAVKAADEVERLSKAAQAWRELSLDHPQTRAAKVRSGTLPLWMYGI